MRKRRIAVVGLGDDATHAFQSMLRILDGRASAAWEVSAPEHADVMMAGASSNDPAIDRWTTTDKPLIAVYEGAAALPVGAHALRHPFRVMQLLGVLDDIERTLDRTPAVAAPAPTPAPNAWAFAESLRRLAHDTAHVAAHDGLHASHSAYGTLFVRDDLSAYFVTSELLQRLAHEPVALSPLEPARTGVPVGCLRRPAFEVAWLCGLHGPTGLAPWLDRRTAHRLRRWPDFGVVRPTREQLALSAALANDSVDVERLALLAHCETSRAERFVNACSMIGLLVGAQEPAAVAPPPAAPPTSPSTRFGNLIRGLRHRLGLMG